jgi:hypothetical protein
MYETENFTKLPSTSYNHPMKAFYMIEEHNKVRNDVNIRKNWKKPQI